MSDTLPKIRARTTPRELHVFDEGLSPKKGYRRYRLEIWEVFFGKRRRLREIRANGNHLGRLEVRYGQQFGIPAGNIWRYDEQGTLTASPSGIGEVLPRVPVPTVPQVVVGVPHYPDVEE